MHKELHSIKLIRDYLQTKNIVKNSVSNIDEVYEFFKYLSLPKSCNKFNSLYILNYINQYIVDDEVAKRKTSARVFEDLIAIVFNGEVADAKKRKNIKSEVPDYFNMAKDKIAGNKREKIDLIFEHNYGISLKTLMLDNIEINLGSFEKNVLFDGFDVTEYLTERKTKSDTGLGSKPRLKNLLLKLKEKKSYCTFKERFEQMFRFIFSDDFILAVKDKKKLHLYFFEGEEFTSFVTSKAKKIEELLTVVNRWEGNSIRIDRTKLIESCSRTIVLDLSVLDDTVIKLVNDVDYRLHQAYINYFNLDKNDNVKNKIQEEIDKLFGEFDKEIDKLK